MIRHLFHRLWTKAVGTDGYIKDDWRRLEPAVELVDEIAEYPCARAFPHTAADPESCKCKGCRARKIRRDCDDGELPSVGGGAYSSEISPAEFERRCRVHIKTEQGKLAPDSALIALLCDGVRLVREAEEGRRRRAMPDPLEPELGVPSSAAVARLAEATPVDSNAEVSASLDLPTKTVRADELEVGDGFIVAGQCYVVESFLDDANPELRARHIRLADGAGVLIAPRDREFNVIVRR